MCYILCIIPNLPDLGTYMIFDFLDLNVVCICEHRVRILCVHNISKGIHLLHKISDTIVSYNIIGTIVHYLNALAYENPNEA